MRRANHDHHHGQDHTARWLALLWRCPCEYANVATYRCYSCGSRPPRTLREQMAAMPVAKATG